MAEMRISGRAILLTLAGLSSASAGLVLVFMGFFPFAFAESGQGSYIAAHRLELILEIVAGFALFYVSWRCFKAGLSRNVRLAVGVIGLLGFFTLKLFPNYRQPAGVSQLSENWYVSSTAQPREIDTVIYHIYRKQGRRYESIEDLAAEYRYVAPDCLIYRGLKVVGRPLYAMCGNRIPAVIRDTMTPESEVLNLARSRPKYRPDWRYNP